ncbi:SDR family NAD(P)-dependent oxidoreductase [Pseudonocardia kunmingensis]|uniref:NAD(P)-dependent dehydrogenase (Short-subunit alcohol dehydrogenase family) n=1 Tax=Pseudonocardia kunmingensis TaxID=630975 RepID=A0A543DPS0_9PSEU|nr:SDR family oxidoreductase [Pseudonocardia kunmingensis]TQM11305.1 NAD(P)-dependent dehydrogenase (short-subunit alcohol dehydrogenase family) [Pseudonocardia kunmingensis]
MGEIDLDGQVAVITGAGAGIGQGIALGLAARGARVVVAEIEPQRAEHTVELVTAAGGRAVAVPTDVMDTAQVEAAVAAAQAHFGRLDILVNNAGGVNGRRFLDQSERSWRRHIDINLVSMLSASWHAAHAMIGAGNGGSIVNVASIEAGRAAPMYAVYAACKAGMLSFTRTMALELGEHGIRVNAIAPDHTRTPGNSGVRTGPVDPAALRVRPAEEQARVDRYVPLGREGVISECGDVVAFLCSPLAAYVTGATIPVDGGTWASSGWVRTEDGGWGLYGRMGGAPA